MSTNIAELLKLKELASLSSKRKPKIILNPKEKSNNEENLDEDIIYDTAEWKLSKEQLEFIQKLSTNNLLSNEDKILYVFDKLCKQYTYDDNILSYMQKIDNETFALPDWYGKDVDIDWEKNRETHNRRVCYEVSRYLAESLRELFKNDESCNICIFWDKELTHYFVGLTCNDYSITLDLDDFNNIKDLTRIKTGLTIEGINILNDDKGKFKYALNNFNESRSKYAIKKIESEIKSLTIDNKEQNENINQTEDSDDIIFLKYAIQILNEKYNIDSQGLFEYMKEIIDIKLGPESRKKVWKRLEGNLDEDTRYIRSLILNVHDKEYIIDVDEKILRLFDESELTEKNAVFIPYKELNRNWRS